MRNGFEERDAAGLVGKLNALDQRGAVALREVSWNVACGQRTFDETREIKTKTLKFRELFGGRFFRRNANGSEQRLEIFARFGGGGLALPGVEIVFDAWRSGGAN